MKRLALGCLLALCLTTPTAHARLFGKSPEKSAAEAAAANSPAVTIWVDATWGFRNRGAANDLTAAHRAFYAQGYRVLSVQPYIENGDLQGFFVTYEKRS
ncbi:hypothetical protein EBB59_00225 [Lysobacter pythonis]|uniref:Uncharacterized protein n=1 Tax=Solilutibacter pythonis TaxID=2483112 RepID=A0A3M2I360_9GAMM|nr:hypothetical protein [Lysobacter pythonis]RMH94765.1 hypothetical protein EBB59_00225 [Lysobacter pythonis]